MYSTCGLALALLLNARAPVAGDNTTTKTIDFVDVIKQNLRRDNDDYELIEQKTLHSSTIRTDPITNNGLSKLDRGTPAEVNNNIINAVNSNRRAHGGQSWEFDYNDIKTQIIKSTATKSKHPVDNSTPARNDSLRLRSNLKLSKYKSPYKTNISNLGGHNEIQLSNLKNSSLNPTRLKLAHIPKLVKNKRINKFKKFMSQNKDLLKLVNSKTKAQVKTQLKQQNENIDLDELLKKDTLRNQVKAADEDRDTKLPDTQLLDMAPARGGRVHKLRVKGRLCFRHVLLPEGPKYDSRGRWYVPEHQLVAAHRYDATPGPRMVLPRCCNCCKKSVLGCQ